jgi:hypothetical protein
MRHSCGTLEDLLEILHNMENMNTPEKFNIYEARKEDTQIIHTLIRTQSLSLF